MATEVILPKVDMDMTTGQISKWFFENGATVKKGDVLFEIETDKAAMEIDAPASGVLRDIMAAEGIDIAVGSPVAWIYEEGEPYVAAPQAGASANPCTSMLETPSTSNERSTERTTSERSDTRATPLARRLARDCGIDIGLIFGSGPKGRVIRADVENYSTDMPPSEAETELQAKALPDASNSEPVLQLFEQGTYERIAHTNMRRTIARRLVEAKSTVPHFYLTLDCHIDAMLKLRAELNASAPEREGKPVYRLSVNDMVIKAYALALKAVPEANVSWTNDNLIRHNRADIGVAVSVTGGLITPIVRNAELKTLSTISREMIDLGIRAREGKLKPSEYQGGTAAISNLGMFGVREFAAIVNPPHATILAVGSGERRAVVERDAIVAATLMTVTLSSDHRAVDGALGAQLIGAFKDYIQKPMSLLV
ncbi:dihydrolipoamide acetyltransferase family protein [Phyllobacterium sp. SB3]|uniref:dihydrolipoamide acetyltransferase family protein n=1 Tax=Phyllobacterium sp. SB3 TaxID=3156073 RepID=UPI0032AEDE57